MPVDNAKYLKFIQMTQYGGPLWSCPEPVDDPHDMKMLRMLFHSGTA